MTQLRCAGRSSGGRLPHRRPCSPHHSWPSSAAAASAESAQAQAVRSISGLLAVVGLIMCCCVSRTCKYSKSRRESVICWHCGCMNQSDCRKNQGKCVCPYRSCCYQQQPVVTSDCTVEGCRLARPQIARGVNTARETPQYTSSSAADDVRCFNFSSDDTRMCQRMLHCT